MPTQVAGFVAAVSAKLNYAECQIAELDRLSSEFFAPQTDDLSARISKASPGETISIDVPQEVTESLSVLCGQIAGSIRSPLDYLACELARNHSGTAEKAAFPFGQDARALEQGIKNGAKLMSDEAKEFIRAQRPRMDGDCVLWSLNELCNIDKHRNLIAGKGIVEIRGVPVGQPYAYAMLPDLDAIVAGATSVPLVRRPLFNHTIRVSCTMAFAEPVVLRDMPVVTTLGEMLAKVRRILDDARPLLR